MEADDSNLVLFENTLDRPVCLEQPSCLFNLLAEREGEDAFDEHRQPPPRMIGKPGVVMLVPGNLIGTRVGKGFDRNVPRDGIPFHDQVRLSTCMANRPIDRMREVAGRLLQPVRPV